MPSIYLAAIITSILAVIIIGTIISRILKKSFFFLLPLSIFFLPASYIAFTFIRVPINKLIISYFKIPQDVISWPLWYSLLALLYAPVIEELVKLFPLVLPWFRRRVSTRNKVPLGMIIGLGFGVGELWLVAFWLSKTTAAYHWYQFWGYMLERLISCFSHGVFTVVALRGLGNKFIKYIIYAIGLHALSNLPIVMSQLRIIKLSQMVFQNIMSLYLLIFTVGLVFILVSLVKEDAI